MLRRFIRRCLPIGRRYLDKQVKVQKHKDIWVSVIRDVFNLAPARNFHWVGAVREGVERLCRKGAIQGRILHLCDSWIGVCQAPER